MENIKNGSNILKDGNSEEFKTGAWKLDIHHIVKKNVKIAWCVYHTVLKVVSNKKMEF